MEYIFVSEPSTERIVKLIEGRVGVKIVEYGYLPEGFMIKFERELTDTEKLKLRGIMERYRLYCEELEEL